MSLEADLLLDRRRLKRRLLAWRMAAVAALAALAWVMLPAELDPVPSAHIARIEIRGMIGEDRRLLEGLERLAEDSSVKALIVAIDSPGGTVAGGEALHAAIRRVAEQKPVVATMGATAASAGYMVALPAHRIFAREGTLTGSIGVLLQSVDVSELLARLGVRAESITSGPLKDQPSPFRPLTEEGRAALESVVQELHRQFIRMVATARGLEEGAVRALADGRVMTGRRAQEAGLIDALGGEREARQWLAEARGVPLSLPVRTIETRPWVERVASRGTEMALRSLIEALARSSILRAELPR
ncbi:MAG: signal peptide peptidase SppA [Rhodovarius sp.]|nr:signal peptide peptidase SppA [Rhodovarius sp.]MCX7931830.1 signal peptide peptidase SppA [Rhodovarius sp.]MDW8313493.1 signal peptide peptidase SppA [Rhodovarius sp.]